MFITLASTKIVLLPLLMYYHCYGNLKFPLAYYEKSESRPYLLAITADILTKVLQKCSSNSPLPNLSFLSNSLNLIGCHGNQKSKFAATKSVQKLSPKKP